MIIANTAHRVTESVGPLEYVLNPMQYETLTNAGLNLVWW